FLIDFPPDTNAEPSHGFYKPTGEGTPPKSHCQMSRAECEPLFLFDHTPEGLTNCGPLVCGFKEPLTTEMQQWHNFY
ncbi:hypothetical protein ABTB71_19340, partial [Acinetobacter baumannii]